MLDKPARGDQDVVTMGQSIISVSAGFGISVNDPPANLREST